MGTSKRALLLWALALVVLVCLPTALSEARRGSGRQRRIRLLNKKQVQDAEDASVIDDERGNQVGPKEDSAKRKGKLFSLFTIVNFKNFACQTNTILTGSRQNRNGTCYSSTDCSDRGGSASGGCAAGFGVCCLFVVTSGTVTQNCTYIQNPNFPGSDTTGQTYTVEKCRNDVCYLRLDFETFNILGTGSTVDADCIDTFTVTATPTQNIPSICGLNTGEHIYVDIGNQAGDTATLAFNLNNANAGTRTWDIKVTQVECSNQGAPDAGCLQYQTAISGRITTFNYNNANEAHANNQQYTVCIRQAEGYCCIQYAVCPDQGNAGFSLDGSSPGTGGADGGTCTEDFIGIPGTSASGACNTTPGATTSSYCGGILNPIDGATVNVPVCDCSPPFTVEVNFDNTADGSTTSTSRGACLTYTQIPC